MRPLRLLTGPARYLGELARGAISGWNGFWFTPADPTALGFVRVCAGALAFWSLLVLGFDLGLSLGDKGWASTEVVREYWAERAPWAWSFWFYVPDGLLRPVWALCVLITGLFMVGLGSRVTSVLTWIIIASTARRAPYLLYGFDQVISTCVLYLAACGASGQAVSLDCYFRRLRDNRAALKTRPASAWIPESGVPRPSIAANIGLRLIQSHLVVIYAMAGIAKLQGRAWWEGTAIWGTLAAGEFRRFDLTWMADWPLLINLLTHGSLAFELVYPFLIWIAPLRPLLIASAVALHLGIDLTLGLTEFGLMMITANFSFASGPWLRSLVTGDTQPLGKVLYDGACPRCRASMAAVSAGDPDRLIEPVDLTSVDPAVLHPGLTKEACMKSMHLVRADGKVEVGYDAVIRLLSWTPLFWLPALVRLVPGVNPLGRKIYQKIADSRPRDVPCTDDVCGLHPRPQSKRDGSPSLKS